MSYIRVIPRDLFNEAKLLKCLGALYIAAERHDDLDVNFAPDGDQDRFDVQQDTNDGSLYVCNIEVIFRGALLHCFTPLNSKLAYPLCATPDDVDETAYVFNDDGTLSKEFLELLPPR